jgi:superfamily II DNA or RNA helicase
MDIREQRQEEAVNAFLTSDRRTIINACPRFGKIKVAFEIAKKLGVTSVWLIAPRNDIFEGWKNDMVKFNYQMPIMVSSTFAGIKNIDTNFLPDLVIIDEPHELSVNQQITLAQKMTYYLGPVLGLTGTLTNKTKIELYDNLNLDTCYTYSINTGVEEGILVDYQMFIHKVGLDNTHKYLGAKRQYTEKKWFDTAMYLKEETHNPKTKHLMNLRAISTIQNSIGKMNKTIDLLKKFKDERVLVFCGVTEIADNLGIPVYHSKAREKELFLDFCVGGPGGTNQLATIKMMQAGVTINPINRGIVNYMSGNPEDSAQKICRFLGLEYDNPGKAAEIHIVSTNEDFELSRLRTGLAFFDQSKIQY